MHNLRFLLLLFFLLAVFIFMQNTKAKSNQSKRTYLPVLTSPPHLRQLLSPSLLQQTGKPSPEDSNALIYPGSKKVAADTYETPDMPEQVTNWFKKKIKDAGYNTTNFVMTKTNENVQNTLVGEKNDDMLRVTIVKNADESMTSISLHHSPS